MSNSISRREALKGAVASVTLLTPMPARAQSLEPITVMTPFGFIGDFIDIMNAYSGGHFRRQGLDHL